MMQIRKFEKYDLSTVSEWLTDRDQDAIVWNEVPEVSFIVEKDGEPIASASLRRCEGFVGIFDGLVTDPKTSLYTRHLAIELLVSKIVETSKDLGLTRLIAFSVNRGTLRRAMKHGFMHLPHSVVSLKIGG